MTAPAGLLDTSVFIAQERSRPQHEDLLPAETFVSVITVAELQAGALIARRTDDRATRLRTLEAVASREPLPITAHVAGHWARLRVRLVEAGRQAPVNDLWIAAIAVAAQLPVVSQDSDYDALDELGLVDVIRV